MPDSESKAPPTDAEIEVIIAQAVESIAAVCTKGGYGDGTIAASALIVSAGYAKGGLNMSRERFLERAGHVWDRTVISQATSPDDVGIVVERMPPEAATEPIGGEEVDKEALALFDLDPSDDDAPAAEAEAAEAAEEEEDDAEEGDAETDGVVLMQTLPADGIIAALGYSVGKLPPIPIKKEVFAKVQAAVDKLIPLLVAEQIYDSYGANACVYVASLIAHQSRTTEQTFYDATEVLYGAARQAHYRARRSIAKA